MVVVWCRFNESSLHSNIDVLTKELIAVFLMTVELTHGNRRNLDLSC